jgi:hypothetical protein
MSFKYKFNVLSRSNGTEIAIYTIYFFLLLRATCCNNNTAISIKNQRISGSEKNAEFISLHFTGSLCAFVVLASENENILLMKVSHYERDYYYVVQCNGNYNLEHNVNMHKAWRFHLYFLPL